MDQQQNAPGKKPDFIAYNVTNSKDGEKSYFNRVGAAWQHKDGQGYEVDLDSIPRDGRITLRAQRDEQMQGYEQQAQAMAQAQQEQGQVIDQAQPQQMQQNPGHTR